MYRDANHIEHASYEDACHYYGADSPRQCELEAQAELEDWYDWCTEFGVFPVFEPIQPEECPF